MSLIIQWNIQLMERMYLLFFSSNIFYGEIFEFFSLYSYLMWSVLNDTNTIRFAGLVGLELLLGFISVCALLIKKLHISKYLTKKNDFELKRINRVFAKQSLSSDDWCFDFCWFVCAIFNSFTYENVWVL